MRRGRPSQAWKLVEYIFYNGGEVLKKDILHKFRVGLDMRRVEKWLRTLIKRGVQLDDGSRIYPLISTRWRGREIIHLSTNVPKPILIYLLYFTSLGILAFIITLIQGNIELLKAFTIIYPSIMVSEATVIAFSGHYVKKKFNLKKKIKLEVWCRYKGMYELFEKTSTVEELIEKTLRKFIERKNINIDDYEAYINDRRLEKKAQLWELDIPEKARVLIRKKLEEDRAERAEPKVKLEKLEVKGLKMKVTFKNVGDRSASISNIFLLEVLRKPEIVEKKGFLKKESKVRVAEKISKTVRPKIYNILPGIDFEFTIQLAKPLEIHQKYMLELHMGEYKSYPQEITATTITKLGWTYLLEFDGKRVKEIHTMNLEEAGIFWEKQIAEAKGERSWGKIYIKRPRTPTRYPYALY